MKKLLPLLAFCAAALGLAFAPTAGAVGGKSSSSRTYFSEGEARVRPLGLGADAALRPASTLSPGERTRAELAAFAALGVNFLVLDEPTNHLDLPAIEQLESALQSFGGTLLLVSHDRRLLETVTTTRRVELPGRDDPSSGLRKG